MREIRGARTTYVANARGTVEEVEGKLTLAAHTNQPVIWMRYTPMEFGIAGDRVLALRFDCRAFKSYVDRPYKKMNVPRASDGMQR